MSILSALFGSTTTKTAQSRAAFPKTLYIGNIWNTAGEVSTGKISVKSGGWVRVGSFTVPPQQLYRFGYGRADLPYNQGYLYMKFFDDTGTPVALPGAVRFKQANRNETTALVVAEYRTEQLSGDAADRNKMMAFPEQALFPMVGEDSLLLIEFLGDNAVAANLTKANCTWNIPVTILQ